jgi:hypothetical protein
MHQILPAISAKLARDRSLPGECNRIRTLLLLALLAGITLMIFPVMGVPTSSLHVVKFDNDGTRVINETTVSYKWMESHLPVQGDGVTHYYHQGPVFVESKEDQWDINETINFKDMGAVKGTAVKDLCDLVGGMVPGDQVMVKSGDGYHVELDYKNIYQPDPRQGQVTVTWFNGNESTVGERQGTGYPPDYYVGMRLVFFADNSTNQGRKHVFGNQDMRNVMPPESIHLFENLYPSTSGYTVKWVDEVRVYQSGYHGSADLLPKSFGSKIDESYPAPSPTKSPCPFLLFPLALVITGILFLRRTF